MKCQQLKLMLQILLLLLHKQRNPALRHLSRTKWHFYSVSVRVGGLIPLHPHQVPYRMLTQQLTPSDQQLPATERRKKKLFNCVQSYLCHCGCLLKATFIITQNVLTLGHKLSDLSDQTLWPQWACCGKCGGI